MNEMPLSHFRPKTMVRDEYKCGIFKELNLHKKVRYLSKSADSGCKDKDQSLKSKRLHDILALHVSFYKKLHIRNSTLRSPKN